jgi:hypothetical protein
MRCEEIFRQICWLEERFWPDVDGMGEEDDTARLGPSLGPMGAGMENGLNSLPSAPMNAPMNAPLNGPINGPMSASSMGGHMNSSHMNGGPMNGGPMNNGDETPVGDGRTSFSLPNGNGLEGVGQRSVLHYHS